MKYLAYRNLVGVSHTELEAKAEAEEQQVRFVLFCFVSSLAYCDTNFVYPPF